MHRSKTPLYSITSSASASKVGGTVTPSAFAVLRLITTSEARRVPNPAIDQTLGLRDAVTKVTTRDILTNRSGSFEM